MRWKFETNDVPNYTKGMRKNIRLQAIMRRNMNVKEEGKKEYCVGESNFHSNEKFGIGTCVKGIPRFSS